MHPDHLQGHVCVSVRVRVRACVRVIAGMSANRGVLYDQGPQASACVPAHLAF